MVNKLQPSIYSLKSHMKQFQIGLLANITKLKFLQTFFIELLLKYERSSKRPKCIFGDKVLFF